MDRTEAVAGQLRERIAIFCYAQASYGGPAPAFARELWANEPAEVHAVYLACADRILALLAPVASPPQEPLAEHPVFDHVMTLAAIGAGTPEDHPWAVAARHACDFIAATQRGAAPSDEQREPDTRRLDWLEAVVNRDGGIVLHDGSGPRGTGLYPGLGLRPGTLDRTLREAIDAAMGAAPEERTPP